MLKGQKKTAQTTATRVMIEEVFMNGWVAMKTRFDGESYTANLFNPPMRFGRRPLSSSERAT